MLTVTRAGLEHAGHWTCHLQHHCQDCLPSNTSNTSSQVVELGVVPSSQMAVLPGQEFYSGEEGEETVMVVRANKQFSVCQAGR